MLSMPTDDRQGMPDGGHRGGPLPQHLLSGCGHGPHCRARPKWPKTPCAQGDRPCVQGFGCRTLETRTVEGVIMMFWYDHNMGWWGAMQAWELG